MIHLIPEPYARSSKVIVSFKTNPKESCVKSKNRGTETSNFFQTEEEEIDKIKSFLVLASEVEVGCGAD